MSLRVVGLVACSKAKLDHAAPARELYQGALFKLARAYVEATCDEWLILSAFHGVVHPDTVIQPYERSLADMPREARKAWGGRTGADIARRYGYGHHADTPTATFLVLASASYVDPMRSGIFVRWLHASSMPLRGLGIGHQKAWLINNLKAAQAAAPVTS